VSAIRAVGRLTSFVVTRLPRVLLSVAAGMEADIGADIGAQPPQFRSQEDHMDHRNHWSYRSQRAGDHEHVLVP
jgi:hypothetical protein